MVTLLPLALVMSIKGDDDIDDDIDDGVDIDDDVDDSHL